MTSINTNISAMAALQTLRTLSGALEKTQGQVSSGLRVAVAADNAAYWSISTTMRSDRMAVSAVSDALGLGAAKVDVAYAGMESVIGVLSEFKAKLIAAKEDGVDKTKIQTELNQFKEQIAGIATSASFSGQNWLNTDITDLYDPAFNKASVVSSFVRDANGVSVKTTNVDLSEIALFNTTGSGLLQSSPSNDLGTIGGFLGQSINDRGERGQQRFTFSNPATFGVSDYIQLQITIDSSADSAGNVHNLTIDRSVVDRTPFVENADISDAQYLVLTILTAARDAGIADQIQFLSGGQGSDRLILRSQETSGHPGSSLQLVVTSSSIPGAFGLSAPASEIQNDYSSGQFAFDTAFTLAPKDAFSFTAKVGNGLERTVTVDRDTVDSVLGVGDGTISSADDMALVLDHVMQGVTVTSDGTNILFSTAPLAGEKSSLKIGNAQQDHSLTIGLFDIDITSSGIPIDGYIRRVETMLRDTTSGAATLGALQSRIDMQAAFAQTVMATIDKGIGRLVDADMNEASTRLKAIQTQQQLALQSLQIANSEPQNLLSLFK